MNFESFAAFSCWKVAGKLLSKASSYHEINLSTNMDLVISVVRILIATIYDLRATCQKQYRHVAI